jgi:hypothetical protein
MKESNNRILHHVSECPVVLSSCTSGHCADWHEQMMKAAGTLNRMTGFLLVYPTCVLHFLEVNLHKPCTTQSYGKCMCPAFHEVHLHRLCMHCRAI